jgi:hypothetical protein
MSTSKAAWELAWRQEFPRNAQAADERDDRAMLSASAYKHGYLAAKAAAQAELRSAKREALQELWAVVPPRATDSLWKKLLSALVDKYAEPTQGAESSPGLAGSAATTGDGSEISPTDVPAPPSAGTHGGPGELDKLREVAAAAWLVLAWIDRSVDVGRRAAERLEAALSGVPTDPERRLTSD